MVESTGSINEGCRDGIDGTERWSEWTHYEQVRLNIVSRVHSPWLVPDEWVWFWGTTSQVMLDGIIVPWLPKGCIPPSRKKGTHLAFLHSALRRQVENLHAQPGPDVADHIVKMKCSHDFICTNCCGTYTGAAVSTYQ